MSDEDTRPKRSARLAAKKKPDDKAAEDVDATTNKKAGKKTSKKVDKKTEQKPKKPTKKAARQAAIDKVAQLENDAAQEEEEAAAARKNASTRRLNRPREPSSEDDAEAERTYFLIIVHAGRTDAWASHK